jgi:hypothetical protein
MLALSQPWTFVRDVSGVLDVPYPSYGFVHKLKHPVEGVLSPYYEALAVPIANVIIEKVEEQVKVKDLVHARSFLQLPLDPKYVKEHNGVHIDLPVNHAVGLYYVCDADAETIVYEQSTLDTRPGSRGVELTEHARVMPKKGRFVVFDGRRYHCSSQPKESVRCVINLNFTVDPS